MSGVCRPGRPDSKIGPITLQDLFVHLTAPSPSKEATR